MMDLYRDQLSHGIIYGNSIAVAIRSLDLACFMSLRTKAA